jgi:hypothetical protein
VLHVQDDLNPDFDETFRLPCRDRSAVLSLTVESKGRLFNDFMGLLKLPISRFRLSKVRRRCSSLLLVLL